MLANDFVGLTTMTEDLQTLTNLAQEFCNKWKLKYNIKKSAVTVFLNMLRQTGTCTLKWGDKDIPRVASTEGIVMYRR